MTATTTPPEPRVERPTPHQFHLAAEELQDVIDAYIDSQMPIGARMYQSLNQVVAWLHQQGNDDQQARRQARLTKRNERNQS